MTELPRHDGPFGTLIRRHRLFLIVLGIAVSLRVLAEVAYWPALFYADSWQYVKLAYSKPIVAFGIDRPSGYPVAIHVLSLFGRDLGAITIVQHLAGLAIGVIAYALLARLGLRRWIAALAAAVILLDAYALALEQHIMAETNFALALVLCAFLAVLYHDRPWAMAASGFFLACAVTLRVAALFAIPAFVLFVLLKSRRPPVLAAALAALVLPLVLYASLHAAHGRGFGFTETGSWVIYGRVASIADCRGADIPAETRGLCQDATARSQGLSPSWYVWSPSSPARHLFGWDSSPRVSGLLRTFAFAIVRQHTSSYLKLVATDFGRFFEPGGGGIDTPLRFPETRSFAWESTQPLKGLRDEYLPHYRRKVRDPAGFLLLYQRVFHTARWLMGAFALAILLATVVRFFGRPDKSARAAYLLLGGMAIGMLLGTVATVELNVRFLVAVVPLLVCGGVLALRDLGAAVSEKWSLAGHRLVLRFGGGPES
jgi:hypothetical protein